MAQWEDVSRKNNPKANSGKRVTKKPQKDKSLRQKATDWIAPYEKATSDFFGNPLENIEKNYKPNKKNKGKGHR